MEDDMPLRPPPLIRSTAFILLRCSKCGKKFNSLINGKCDICRANQNDGSKKRRSKKRRSKIF